MARLTIEAWANQLSYASLMREFSARLRALLRLPIDLDWVTESLAVGGAFLSSDARRLRGLGITAVVDCRDECGDDANVLAEQGIELLRLSAPDRCEFPEPALDDGVMWVQERLRHGKVLLHCARGVGRSPLLACCVLVAEGFTSHDAFALVTKQRLAALLSARQLAGLRRFAARAGGRSAPQETVEVA
ncbi:MAG: hypothetical protein QOF51_141 [Chloroflexota bacterium]|nr:hypothetical protein [Chloroflexota bacterium]